MCHSGYVYCIWKNNRKNYGLKLRINNITLKERYSPANILLHSTLSRWTTERLQFLPQMCVRGFYIIVCQPYINISSATLVLIKLIIRSSSNCLMPWLDLDNVCNPWRFEEWSLIKMALNKVLNLTVTKDPILHKKSSL